MAALCRFQCALSRFRILSFYDEARPKKRFAFSPLFATGMFDEDIDLTDVPHLHRRVNRVPVDRVPIQGDQAYGVPSGADDEISAGGKQLCQRRRTGISAVSDKNVALCYRQPGECLAAVRIGYIEIGEARPGRVVGSMHPEIELASAIQRRRLPIECTPEEEVGKRAPAILPNQSAAPRKRFSRATSEICAMSFEPARVAAERKLIPPAPYAEASQTQQGSCIANAPLSHKSIGGTRSRIQIDVIIDLRYQILPVGFDGNIASHLPYESHLDSAGPALS